MKKIVLSLLAGTAFFYTAAVFADADMFRIIEQTENEIDKDKGYKSGSYYYYQGPSFYNPDPYFKCYKAPGYDLTACEKAARKYYDDPPRHGRPIVPDQDY